MLLLLVLTSLLFGEAVVVRCGFCLLFSLDTELLDRDVAACEFSDLLEDVLKSYLSLFVLLAVDLVEVVEVGLREDVLTLDRVEELLSGLYIDTDFRSTLEEPGLSELLTFLT